MKKDYRKLNFCIALIREIIPVSTEKMGDSERH